MQDLPCRADPTQETCCATVDHADYTALTRRYELHHTDQTYYLSAMKYLDHELWELKIYLICQSCGILFACFSLAIPSMGHSGKRNTVHSSISYVYVYLSNFRTFANFSLRTKHFSAKHRMVGRMNPGRTHWSRSRRDPCKPYYCMYSCPLYFSEFFFRSPGLLSLYELDLIFHAYLSPFIPIRKRDTACTYHSGKRNTVHTVYARAVLCTFL